MNNLAAVRRVLGQVAASAVLNEFRLALSDLVELPSQQVLPAGDDCFLVWLPEEGADLEDILVRIGTRLVCVEGHSIAVLTQAGWTALRADQPRELVADEVSYVLFASACSVANSQVNLTDDRFLADMTVASRVIEALGRDQIHCQWQGVSGLYGDNSFLYWRGMARPHMPEFEEPFAASQGFMPALERLNLTRALDRHMALRVLGQLISMPALRLACRISSLSVLRDHYWDSLLSILAAHPAAARRFTLEISGQVPLPSREAARSFCASIRDLGAHIAMADFGCGPFNLADLQACRPRTLLLDESFVLRCRHHEEERVALRDMVRICADLAEHVVVTGVNNDRAHSDVMRAGARWISGDFVNPVPPFASRFWRSWPTASRSRPAPNRPQMPEFEARGQSEPETYAGWSGPNRAATQRYVQ